MSRYWCRYIDFRDQRLDIYPRFVEFHYSYYVKRSGAILVL